MILLARKSANLVVEMIVKIAMLAKVDVTQDVNHVILIPTGGLPVRIVQVVMKVIAETDAQGVKLVDTMGVVDVRAHPVVDE